MKLILSGGGDGSQVKESYQLFSKLVGKGKVLYIPLAWNHGNMNECINWFKSEMAPFGVVDIEDVLSPEEITKERLSNVKGVFIGGGNTFKLLKMLKYCDAFNNLESYLNNGGIIMGGSAGALIFGKTIDTCLADDIKVRGNDENLVELQDTSGFDKVNGYSLFVHYKAKSQEDDLTKKKVEKLTSEGNNLICLPEETSIYINNKEIVVIGQKPAEMYSNGTCKVLEPVSDEKI